jgi:hypothetical protein
MPTAATDVGAPGLPGTPSSGPPYRSTHVETL